MKKPVNVTLDAELWKRFRIRAIQDGTSGSAVLDRLMRLHLGESVDGQTGRRAAPGHKADRGKARDSVRAGGGRKS